MSNIEVEYRSLLHENGYSVTDYATVAGIEFIRLPMHQAYEAKVEHLRAMVGQFMQPVVYGRPTITTFAARIYGADLPKNHANLLAWKHFTTCQEDAFLWVANQIGLILQGE